MSLKEHLMEKLISDFERVIEDTPLCLTRQDIRKCFQRALAFYRDASEVRKKEKPEVHFKLCDAIGHEKLIEWEE